METLAPATQNLPLVLPAVESDRPHATEKPAHSEKPAYRARWISETSELESLSEAWDDLVNNSLQTNLFFDHRFLVPLLNHIVPEKVDILVVESDCVRTNGPPTLYAILPLVRKRLLGIPMDIASILQSDYLPDSTPLVRNSFAAETFDFLFQALSEQRIAFLNLNTITSNTKFEEVLNDAITRGGFARFRKDHFERAALTTEASFEVYQGNHFSKNLRKRLRRCKRQLAEKDGETNITTSNASSDFRQLAEDFLRLEACGWKGRSGTAMKCNSNTREFFCEMIRRQSSGEPRVVFSELKLGGKPIAMLCDIFGDDYAVAYKTAFDEDYAKQSPGLLLEVHNIENAHQRNVRSIDSCTAPGSSAVSRIWNDKVQLQSTVIGLGGLPTRMIIRSLPLLQTLYRTLRKRNVA
ncbi:hypothetical protein Q31b_24550 [Novipirellula aureliae]|uniref:BioF2-like acetyltransferase domain-containing protein n=1 Tax=Novipirellula aureliae TaxID=2527966 RepID=A0A5C6E7G7_9BACT|nr:GNAT family N-acetyltransferase [Novipirellula aureliae]TWU43416.1 hypothetical protein Q31b_24550 [Novipirellula aureliae]